jgi:hypothetical protein
VRGRVYRDVGEKETEAQGARHSGSNPLAQLLMPNKYSTKKTETKKAPQTRLSLGCFEWMHWRVGGEIYLNATDAGQSQSEFVIV